MTEQLYRSFEDQLVRAALALLLFSTGIVQLFFIKEIQKRFLRLRQYLGQVFERHPTLIRMFGPPLKTVDLKGYTIARRIGGVILIILSIGFLISMFQPPGTCDDDYWRTGEKDRVVEVIGMIVERVGGKLHEGYLKMG